MIIVISDMRAGDRKVERRGENPRCDHYHVTLVKDDEMKLKTEMEMELALKMAMKR
jgi:hypothetical protein